ncbi:hypothetical protein C6502_11300 [Candidatus Poribacteria bacterium]|nr:MAG: hypothetical protein C6502_11300 [Candidatus Poribacteria bacterium]
MKEKKNLTTTDSSQQLTASKSMSEITQLTSESLKKTLLELNLLAEDFEKSDNFVDQIEHLAAAPLEFDISQRKIVRLIENLRVITGRAAKNHRYLVDTLEGTYGHALELVNAIGETHTSINARFKFWLHPFHTENQHEEQKSRELSNFAEFLDLLAEKPASYAYFLALFKSKPLLICRYIPPDTEPQDNITYSLSSYVAPPSGSFRGLKRAWNKLFKSPNKSVFHLFCDSYPKSSLGTFKGRSPVLVGPYAPYQHSESDQLTKIIYDFINIYGISGCIHVHLLKHKDQCAIFTTQRHVEFDGNSIQLADTDCPAESPKDRHQLIIE